MKKALFLFIFLFADILPIFPAKECGYSDDAGCQGVNPCFNAEDVGECEANDGAPCENDDSEVCESCSRSRDCGSGECYQYAICDRDDNGERGECQENCTHCWWEKTFEVFLCGCTRDNWDCPEGHTCDRLFRSGWCQDADNNIITSTNSSTTTVTGSEPCLSGYSTVTVLGKGTIDIKDMELGDKVIVNKDGNSGDDVKHQEVYGYGHVNLYAIANFFRIATEGNNGNSLLELSGEHLIYHYGAGVEVPVRADAIRVGDSVVVGNNMVEKVTKIVRVDRQGIYSPLVKDGVFMAGDVKVSSYTAPNNNPQYVQVGDTVLPLSHHMLSHIAISPFRALCTSVGFRGICEERNAEGQLLFAAMGEQTISSTLMNYGFVIPTMTLMVVLGIFMPVYFLEQVYLVPNSGIMFALVVMTFFLQIWFQSKKSRQ